VSGFWCRERINSLPAWLSRLRHSVTTAKESVSHVSLIALKAAGVQPEEECMNEMESKLPVVLQCILGPCKLRAETAAMTAVAAQVRYIKDSRR
jgi:hypothetical protein